MTIWPYLSDKENKFKFIPGQGQQNVGQQANNAMGIMSKTLQSSNLGFNNGLSQFNNSQNSSNSIITLQSIDLRSAIDKVHCPY